MEESMLDKDDLFLLEDDPTDEPTDLLTFPEVRQHVSHDHHDDEFGLRLLLERPEALSQSDRRVHRRRTRSHRHPKRGAQRAA
jgi:hypothetical protein